MTTRTTRTTREYTNPVLPGFYPDPSVVKVGEDYYLATSSFEYFPAVPIFHSLDLVNWRQIGHVLNRSSQLDMSTRKSSEGIYAPSLRYHEGVFYLITTDVGGIGNFYVSATDPAGPWSEPIVIPFGGIDPSLLFEDGKAYVTVQNGWEYESHIIQYEIDIQTGEALTVPVVVWEGDEGPWTEGPHLYKIDGRYYLMAASGGTGDRHREIICRSDSPYGPFEVCPTPILTHSGIKEHPIQNTGHADLIEDAQGNWWAFFLGVRPVTEGRYSVLGRETFLAPVHWKDGWPMIDYNAGTVGLSMQSDLLQAGNAGAVPYRTMDQFNAPVLGPQWSFLRTVEAGCYTLGARPGWLGLLGNERTLSDEGPTVFVSQRQRHTSMKAVTRLDFNSPGSEDEAGLAVRLAEHAYAAIGLRHSGGRRSIIVTTAKDGRIAEAVLEETKEEGAVIYLSVSADLYRYEFAYSYNGTDWLTLGSEQASALSPELNGGFTGVCLGLYATGNGGGSRATAFFDFFAYEEI